MTARLWITLLLLSTSYLQTKYTIRNLFLYDYYNLYISNPNLLYYFFANSL
jgi:hypothetical protein